MGIQTEEGDRDAQRQRRKPSQDVVESMLMKFSVFNGSCYSSLAGGKNTNLTSFALLSLTTLTRKVKTHLYILIESTSRFV